MIYINYMVGAASYESVVSAEVKIINAINRVFKKYAWTIVKDN
jgi:hypothetical protein